MPHADAELTAVGAEETEIAYAKINLALHVRHRRDDGYHALESLFAFTELGDGLTGRIRSDGQIRLEIAGPFAASLDAGADNLVIRAARALQAHLGTVLGAELKLTKNLPVASGIGGGSADAAATLRLLARLWHAPLDIEALEQIALTLGSDVPACIGSVSQMVRGRGEWLQPQDIAGLAAMPILLVNPGVSVSTAMVFRAWDQVDRGPLRAHGLAQLISDGRNDLEAAAIGAAPVISDVLAALKMCRGALLVRMSGSGATCFALFETEQDRAAAAARLRADHGQWWIAETRIRAA